MSENLNSQVPMSSRFSVLDKIVEEWEEKKK